MSEYCLPRDVNPKGRMLDVSTFPLWQLLLAFEST